jgi:pimeloyl-ACP methyl ester carboxylesterase
MRRDMKIASPFSIAVALAVALPMACSDEQLPSEGAGAAASGTTSSSSSGGTGGGPPIEPAIAWSACPLYVDQPDGVQAECATIDVPLRWSEPDGPSIGIFVQRLSGTAGTIRGQLWLLEGGPGGSGADFDSWMEELRALDPGLDLYAVDHRGVGRSARLSCAEQETESSDWGVSVSPGEAPACRDAVQAAWGDDLDEFTTTAAARDLGRLIEVAAQPEQDVLVYGVSYGTYWAHRYLQLHPEQATAVILDSIAPPGEDFLHYDEDFDAVGQDLMDLCAADATCAAKLGPDPWAAIGALSVALDAGHCPAITATWGLDASTLRVVLAYLLMSPLTRTYLPALVYRYARCDAGDVSAIDQLLTVLFGGPATTSYYETLSSDALFYNVALSELWPNAPEHPTDEEIAASEAALYVTTGLTPRVAAVQDAWPAYADDAYVGAWATTATPLLMMNGDLDPMTPIWVGGEAGEHFTGDKQWFFTIPRSAHAVTSTTPVANDGDVPCGLQILLGFLADPQVEPDTTCIADIPQETFTGNPGLNQYLLGTADLWENTAAAAAPTAAPQQLRRWLRESRRLR